MLSSLAPEDYITTSVEFSISVRRSYCLRITLVDDEVYDNVFNTMSFRVVLESNDSVVSFGSDASVSIQENDGEKTVWMSL